MTDQFEISQRLQRFLDKSPARAVARLENAISTRASETRTATNVSTFLILVQEVLKSEPLVYYRFAETSGTQAEDATDEERHGTYTNGPVLGEPALIVVPPGGDANYSARFLGASDTYVAIGSPAELDITGDLSIEFWIKTTSTTFDVILGAWDPSTPFNGYGAAVGQTLPGVLYYYADNTWHASTAVLNDGVPHHVVITATATAIKFTVDGVVVTTLATDGQPSSYPGASGRKWAANNTPGGYLTGWLDEVAIYDRELTLTEITAHYNAGTAGEVLL